MNRLLLQSNSKRMRSFYFLALTLFYLNSSLGQGVILTNDHIKDYARLLEIQGQPVNNPIIFNSSQFEIWEHDSLLQNETNPWRDQLEYYQDEESKGLSLYLLSPRIDYTYNSKYSRTYNDGPLWSGRGSTVGLNAGIKVKWGPVTGVLYPNFYHAQNKHYKRQSGLQPAQHELNYQLSSQIDWVQIFGYEPFSEFDFGQSYIAATAGPVTLKFGTENMWWGPSVINPIMMSNTAPGFPHLDLGTTKPVRTKYGDFEFHSIWGELGESEWFENIPSSDRRYMVGLTFGYRPSFAEATKGLSIGISRVLQKNWPDSGLPFGDIFLALKNADPSARQLPSGGFVNDETDQLLSLDLRWFFEEAGFDLYFEWVRNDFWLNFKDLVQEPEHGSVFSLGFQKVLSTGNRSWRLGFEHTSLATTRTLEIRNSGDIYTHSIVRQGYTHKGHLLGAPIGPGSKSQLIRLDRFDEKGKYGFSIHRIRFNDNHFWRRFRGTGDFLRHDVEWNFGLEAVRFFRNFEFSSKFIYSRRMNWHYYHALDVNNFQLLTSVRWHIMNKPLLSLEF